MQVFSADRFNDASADIALEPVSCGPEAGLLLTCSAALAQPLHRGATCTVRPKLPPTLPPACPWPLCQGLCAEYDASAAELARLQAEVGAAVEGVREALRGRGHPEPALRKVKLAEYRGERLLQVRDQVCAGGAREVVPLLGSCLRRQARVVVTLPEGRGADAWLGATVGRTATPFCSAHNRFCRLGLVQVPTAAKRDLLDLVSGCTLVKEAETLAKYRVPELAATLEVHG